MTSKVIKVDRHKAAFHGKRVLVTGACGTVGRELIRQLAMNSESQPSEIIGLDNNESAVFFEDQDYLQNDLVRFQLADIRDSSALKTHFEGVDIVFHTAALKHVVLSERSPEEAVKTNILGVQNVIEVAEEREVEKVIFTSSDKAVNPTNVMGTSKLMGERLITAANGKNSESGSIYASTRFGNVLGSNGSVYHVFKNQILSGKDITLTNTEMTRFVMSIEESVKLVIDSSVVACGGEIFVTKMPVVRIVDLAQAMIQLFAPLANRKLESVRIDEIGSKPGEKLYEELMSDEETGRAVELEQYFSVLPAFRGVYAGIDYNYPGSVNPNVTNPYLSSQQDKLSVEEIVELLKSYNLHA